MCGLIRTGLLAVGLVLLIGAAAAAAARSIRQRPPIDLRAAREGYGGPPGWFRAMSHLELGDRGWPDAPREYEANTASAISHMIERSA